MDIQTLAPAKNSRTAEKRIGRGIGSGIGKTSGKGHKGQNARSGGGVRPGFEGGQLPLVRKLPIRGFNNYNFQKEYATCNVADLEKFDGSGIEVTQNNIPLIKNPYENVEWDKLSYNDTRSLFEIKRNEFLLGSPKIVSINVDNYQGVIQIKALFADRVEWYLDEKKIKTKYNTAGLFTTELKVKNLIGKNLKFKLIGIGGETISKYFEIFPQEVL